MHLDGRALGLRRRRCVAEPRRRRRCGRRSAPPVARRGPAHGHIAAGLAEPHSTEPGDAGPNRTVHRATDAGNEAVTRWLDRPVAHIRDLRIEFLAKLRLNQRRSRDAHSLVAAQRAALADTFDQLTGDEPADVVDRWRRSNATAARSFLDHLMTVDSVEG